MPKQIPYINEIISLLVMLLMLAALVAGQAEARSRMVAAGATSDVTVEIGQVLIRGDVRPKR